MAAINPYFKHQLERAMERTRFELRIKPGTTGKINVLGVEKHTPNGTFVTGYNVYWVDESAEARAAGSGKPQSILLNDRPFLSFGEAEEYGRAKAVGRSVHVHGGYHARLIGGEPAAPANRVLDVRDVAPRGLRAVR